MNARMWFVGLFILGAGGCGESHPGTTNGSTSASGGPACVPSVEICGNGIDEDCSGDDCAAVTTWAKRFGGKYLYQSVTNVAQVPDGSVFIVGDTSGNIDWGDGNPFPSGSVYPHPFLAKFNSDGSFAWLRDAGEGVDGMNWGQMNDVLVVDGSNDIITTGYVYDAFHTAAVWRWDAEGNPVPGWGKGLFGPYEYPHYRGSRLALSPDKTMLYVSGTVQYIGTFACASSMSFDTAGAFYPFVAAIEMSTGNCVWGRVYEGDNHFTEDVPIAVTKSGGITLASVYRGTAPQGSKLPDTVQPGDAQDRTYMLRLDPANGDIIHAMFFPPPNVGTFMGTVFPNPWIERMISIDDTVYAAGKFYATIGLPEDPVYPFSLSTDLGDNGNALVMEVDPKVLGVRWAERIRGTRYSPEALSLAAFGDELMVGGASLGAVYPDPAANEATLCTDEDNSYCFFVFGMGRTDRTRRWFRQWVMFRESQWTSNFQIAAGPDGLALTAQVIQPLDLGTGQLEPKGERDIVVAKLPMLP